MTLRYHQYFDNGIFGKYANVMKKLPSTGSILEVGCNTGYFSRFLMDQGYQVLGLEIDPDAIIIARQKGVHVITVDVENSDTLEAIEQTFDVILLMDVLEHLKYPSIVLNNLRSKLNPNGSIIVTVPNIAFWKVRLNLLFGKWEYEDAGILDKTHLRFYNRKGWIKLIETSGYRIVLWESAVGGMSPLQKGTWISKQKMPWVLAARLGVTYFPDLFSVGLLFHATPNSIPFCGGRKSPVQKSK